MDWKRALRTHRSETIYEIESRNMANLDRYCRNNITENEVFFSLEEALEAARKVAHNTAWQRQLFLLDEPKNDGIRKNGYFAFIYHGRKISKNGNIYGFPKVVYVISDMTEEMMNGIELDKRMIKYKINEYTEQPVLTKDMFQQWEDEE